MKRLRTAAVLIVAAALAGCASFYTLDTDVSSFSRWPAGRAPSTYAFERLPSQQAQPQQAQMLEDAARPALESAGLLPAPAGSAADVTIQVGARITETDRSPFDDPFWYRGRGLWHRPFAYGRHGRFGGPGWRWGAWDPFYDLPVFEREVGLLVRDKASGEPLYEARAETQGLTTGVTTILPAMFGAAMRDFPLGNTANPHRVSVELPH